MFQASIGKINNSNFRLRENFLKIIANSGNSR
jgi:hypothetical protein